MKLYRLITILLFFAALSARAEEKIDFVTLDRETYRYYTEQKWDSLIELGKKGLKQGFDYYYLRYRLGVAYYELHHYGKAALHFEKAYTFNREDNTLKEYLYYASIFLNRRSQAAFYAGQLPEKRQEELLYFGQKALKSVDIEAGAVISNDKTQNPPSEVWGDSSSYLENHYAGNRLFARTGVEMQLSPRIIAYAGYTRLTATKESSYRYSSDLQPDTIISTELTNDYYYSYAEENREITSTVKQNEIYFKLDVLAGTNWLISPFAHYLGVNYTGERVTYFPRNDSAILYYDKTDDSYHYFDYVKNDYQFKKKKTLLNDYVAGISVSKMFPVFTLKLSTAVAQLNFEKRLNISGSIAYFPLGNLNLYGSTSLSWFSVYDSPIQNEAGYVVGQDIGVRLLKFLWMEASMMFGSIENTWRNDAFVVYNVPDKINYMAGADLIILISPDLELNLRYQYWSREGTALHYYLNRLQQPASEIVQTTYQNQMITGGLKWKL